MAQHCRMEHGTSRSVKHYFMSKVVNHLCLLCGKKVACESKRLTDHMLKKHAFNLANYEEKYYFPSHSEYRVYGKDSVKKHDKRIYKKAVEANDDDQRTEEELQDKAKLSETDRAASPVKSVDANSYKDQYENEEQNGIDLRKIAWRDACKFACNQCSKVTSNRYVMVYHSKREHGTDGTTNHYQILEPAEHKCLLCKMVVLQDAKNLTTHMNRRHDISLSLYEEKYYFPSLHGDTQEGQITI